MQAVFDRVTKRGNVRVNRISGFVSCNIERGHAASSKLLHQRGGHEALLAVEMAQRAENQPRFDAAGSDTGFRRAIHGRHHLFGRQAALQMQQRREADFGVDHAVGGELLEQILNNQFERRFILHQLEAARRARQKIGKTGAAPRSDEFALVFFERNGVIQLRHRGVAQRAIQMQMQFNLGKFLHIPRVSRLFDAEGQQHVAGVTRSDAVARSDEQHAVRDGGPDGCDGSALGFHFIHGVERPRSCHTTKAPSRRR